MSGKEGVGSPTREERRNRDRRGDRIWTQAERDRFIAELREARRDAQAVTVQAGDILKNPKPESDDR